MKSYLGKQVEKLLSLGTISRDELLYRRLPQGLMELMGHYFRLQVEGLEHIPRKGPAIVTPNHSGYAGFDALLLAHEITKELPRIPRIMTHHLWFANQRVGSQMQKLGFVEATYTNAQALLERQNLLVLFPEGEAGNFKPSSKMYQLQEFKRSAVRLAIEQNCPIIPTLIIGAEESQINLKQLHIPRSGISLPVPLNLIPLPVKWKIVFLEPIHFPYGPDSLSDRELMHELMDDLRSKMQNALNRELAKRSSIFF